MERYIDVDKLILDIQKYLIPTADDDGTVTVENAERYFLELIKKQPVTEVIKCKKCKHLRRNNKTHETYCNWTCAFIDKKDFCSFGKEKEKKYLSKTAKGD